MYYTCSRQLTSACCDLLPIDDSDYDLKILLYVCLAIGILAAPGFAKVTLISHTLTYELRTFAGPDSDLYIAPSVPISPCDSAALVSAYSSNFCWSPGTGDPTDSAWTLLYGTQQACATITSVTNELRKLTSSTNISGGVIFPGCNLGVPSKYRALGHARVNITIQVTDAPADYALIYNILGEDWGGEIMGGITTIAGYLRISRQGGSVVLEDTIFVGADVADAVDSGSLPIGNYQIAYEIFHTHSGVLAQPWFPNGQSLISFDLDFGAVTCGDLDASGQVDVTDAVYLINYIFAGGQAPQDSKGGDVNCSNQTDVTDAVYMINYIFASGAAPCAACQ